MSASNIADKVVVITGSSSGIGESTTKLLARSGAKVALGATKRVLTFFKRLREIR